MPGAAAGTRRTLVFQKWAWGLTVGNPEQSGWVASCGGQSPAARD